MKTTLTRLDFVKAGAFGGGAAILAACAPAATAIPAAAATAIPAAAAVTETVTVFHDKGFWKTGLDLMSATAKEDGISLAFSDYNVDQFQAYIQSSLLAGDPPQAFTWWNGTKLKEIVDTGFIAPLDDLWAKKIASGEYDASSAAPFTENGKIYGMPTGLNSWVVLYNKSLFEKAGIAAPPTTWEEFTGAADKLKAAGITPFVASVQDGWRGFIWFEEFMIRTDPEAYIALNLGKIKYTDEPVRKAMMLWADFYAKGYFNDPTTKEEQLDFARGKGAMNLIGDWAIGQVEAGGIKAGTDFDAFLMPNFDSKLPGAYIVEGGPLVISLVGAQNPAVMKFAEWWMTEKAMNAWATDPGMYAGNTKAKMPNPIISKISKVQADGKYRAITRYWEASPSDIVLPAVEEFNAFMLKPSTGAAETAMKNIEAIAAKYWASH